MQKSTMQQNILKKAKQRFIVTDLPPVIVITRGTIDVGTGAINLPDGTKVAGGRVEPGEFTVTLQFGDDEARKAYIGWFNQAKDSGDDGINPNYKRNGEIRFLRSYKGSPSGGLFNRNDVGDVTAFVYGIWCQKYTIPDADIDAADGDGFTTLECTLSYDDAEVEMT